MVYKSKYNMAEEWKQFFFCFNDDEAKSNEYYREKPNLQEKFFNVHVWNFQSRMKKKKISWLRKYE